MGEFRQDKGFGRYMLKPTLLILLASLLLLPIVFPLALLNDEVTVIVEFYGKNYDDAITSLNELKREGISFKVVDILSETIIGSVIKISESELARLRALKVVKEVYEDSILEVQLDKSAKLIGANKVWNLKDYLNQNITGKGVLVAVIDTGVDYTHPDLGGRFGVKVVGGYDFADNDNDPMDKDGHGTMIAGIIAANGSIKGIAPDAKILAYRVLSMRSYLKVSNVVRALERSLKDGAKVVNLSFGSVTDSQLLKKVLTKITKKGVVVVAAAGNYGPIKGTVSEPASEPYVLGVGASMNNVSLSLASSLEILELNQRIPTYPMNGSVTSEDGVVGELVFVKYARKKDVENLDLRGKIALAERGGEFGELVYFAEKEANVAKKGAIGLIVYNNMRGVFFGTLTGPGLPGYLSPPHYKPSIPTVSMSREDGLKLRRLIEHEKITVRLKVMVYPDYVAQFSSRGPSSSFTIKPDLLAPGTFINTTYPNSRYEVISGTSFAAPHVVGVAALLLQRYPNLKPMQVYSILTTTSKPLNNPIGEPFSVYEQGAGRIDALKAINSNLVIEPRYLVFHVADGQNLDSRILTITSLTTKKLRVNVSLTWKVSSIDVKIENNSFTILPKSSINLTMNVKLKEEVSEGSYEGRLFLYDGYLNYTLPFVVQVNSLPIGYEVHQGELFVKIINLNGLIYADATIYTPSGEKYTKEMGKDGLAIFYPDEVGEYWIEVSALTKGGTKVGRAVAFVRQIKPLAKIRQNVRTVIFTQSTEDDGEIKLPVLFTKGRVMVYVFYVASMLIILIMILAYMSTKSERKVLLISNKKEYFIAYLFKDMAGNNV
jgi:minor extracellular serine protease Vpr